MTEEFKKSVEEFEMKNFFNKIGYNRDAKAVTNEQKGIIDVIELATRKPQLQKIIEAFENGNYFEIKRMSFDINNSKLTYKIKLGKRFFRHNIEDDIEYDLKDYITIYKMNNADKKEILKKENEINIEIEHLKKEISKYFIK